LADQAPTHASAGSLNNQWGVPLSLARMPRDTVYAVFELGMNHAGELTPLSRQVRPHVALITNVEAVHLGHFPSVEAIAEAKAEIFAGLEKGGIAVLNRDNPHYDYLAGQAMAAGAERIIGFGTHAEAEARITKYHVHADCTCVAAEIDGQPMTYKVGIAGAHWAINSAGILAVVAAVGGDLGRAAITLANLTPLKGRGERHAVHLRGGDITVVDESYNASPVAMRAAFAALGHVDPQDGGRRIAVLGDMLELGDDSATLHADLKGDLEAAGIDLVFAAGPHMKTLYDALAPRLRGEHAENSAALIPVVLHAIRPGDVVLVKGSLGSRMAPVVAALLDLGRPPARAVNG
jgi:UDP-N-acetylmuramoyl-tripeptide--D-alanyl-D-alanine ligase